MSVVPDTLETVELCDLPALWQAEVVDIPCRVAADLANDPAFPGKIRGALGQVLLRSASPDSAAGHACPWQPPCTLDVLFRDQGRLTKGLTVPKPWVIEVWPVDAMYAVVRFILFGVAAPRASAVAEALVLALREGFRDRVEPVERVIAPYDRELLLEAERTLRSRDTTTATLDFVSPVILRRGAQAGFDAVSLFTSLGNRISGLARWMGLDVSHDWRGLKEAAERLDVDMSDLKPTQWTRNSSRQHRDIPMGGFMGTLALHGDLAPLAPVIALGTVAHCGSHAAIGLGRYNLFLMT